MKKILLFSGLLMLWSVSGAYSATCSAGTDCPLRGATELVALDSNCQTAGTVQCWNGNKISSCATCKSGYSIVKKTVTVSSMGCDVEYNGCEPASVTCSTSSSGCSGTAASISDCSTSTQQCFGGKAVRTCTKCATGYELTSATLTVSGCSNSYSYKKCTKIPFKGCKNGWYRNGSLETCLACPGNTSSDSGIVTDSSAVETVTCGINSKTGAADLPAAITACFYAQAARNMGAQTVGSWTECSYSDTSGTYKYTNDCYYSN